MIPLIIALFCSYVGLVVGEAYNQASWQYYCTLSLVDFMFLYIVGASSIERIKKRWMSCLLFLAILFSLLTSVPTYIYEFYNITFIDYIATWLHDLYIVMGAVISILMILVAVMPKRILQVLNDNYWPSRLNSIYNCDRDYKYKNIKKNFQR